MKDENGKPRRLGRLFSALRSLLFFALMVKPFLKGFRQERRRFSSQLFFSAVTLFIWVMAPFEPFSAAANNNRIVREDSNGDGKIDQVAHLNGDGKLVRLEIDQNGDGRFEVVQRYDNGVLTSLETDTDGDGTANERDSFQGEKRLRHEKLDTKGRAVEMLSFDSQNRVQEWQRDTTGDGKIDTVHEYAGGILIRITRDGNGDGKIDIWERYEKGILAEQKKDSNGNGRIDQVVFYLESGEPKKSLHDTDGNGTLETARHYRGGKLDREEQDTNHDGRPDVVIRYENGEPVSLKQFEKGRTIRTSLQAGRPCLRTIDENGDGRPEQTIRFDAMGNLVSVESDTNGNGSPDTWQQYESGKLVRLDQDRDHDGRRDVTVAYIDGKVVQTSLDTTGDGKWDTVQRSDDPVWSMVTEVDRNEDGRPEERLSYAGDILRRKEAFQEETGSLILRIEYDEQGRIKLSEEAADGAPYLNLVWHYDEKGNAVLAEKDSDGDEKPDIWYHYRQGRMVSLEEDRNRDGKPDFWQTYDDSQNPSSQREDLDFDGVADVTYQF